MLVKGDPGINPSRPEAHDGHHVLSIFKDVDKIGCNPGPFFLTWINLSPSMDK